MIRTRSTPKTFVVANVTPLRRQMRSLTRCAGERRAHRKGPSRPPASRELPASSLESTVNEGDNELQHTQHEKHARLVIRPITENFRRAAVPGIRIDLAHGPP